jgi:hypothetical protein
MNSQPDPEAEGSGDYLRLSEYNDSIRRPSRSLSAERRLLCAVLEDAIRTYLANVARSSRKQCDAFHEVSEWFLPSVHRGRSLFAFQTICDLLEINSEEIRAGLHSLRRQDLPFHRQHSVFSHTQVRQRVARRRVDENWRRLSIRPRLEGPL